MWQYLLAQYGFSPLRMRSTVDEVTRVGDALILPKWGFNQELKTNEVWENESSHAHKKPVRHAMLGRWRGKHG